MEMDMNYSTLSEAEKQLEAIDDKFQQYREMYLLARMMQEDLPDGMGEELLDCWVDYRESGKTPDDKGAFCDAIDEVCNDWGFSLT